MLGSKAKRELQKNQRRICIDSIEIGISSPQQISTWGERRLPNGKKVGQVKNSKTVNYKRFTPLRDGLFCERIFGPVKSNVCACGKRQPRSDITFCDKCEVEYTDQRARRYRLGHISLVSPVAHMWYLKGRPSYISLFLGKRKNRIVQLAYANAYLVEQSFPSNSTCSLASVPSKVRTPIFEREKHGANRYTKNIQTYLATRQIDHMFSCLKEKELNTSPYFLSNTSESITDLQSKSFCANRVFDKQKEDTDHEKFKSNTNLQQVSFQSFEQNRNTKKSPISFFSLFMEILGYMKKDIVLINCSLIENTVAHQLSAQEIFCAEKEKHKRFLNNSQEDLLSLRALWGYVSFQESAQHIRDASSLLNTYQSSPFSSQKHSSPQSSPKQFLKRRANQAENSAIKASEKRVFSKVSRKSKAFFKKNQLGYHSSSKLSQYIFYAKLCTPPLIKKSLYFSGLSQICSLNLFLKKLNSFPTNFSQAHKLFFPRIRCNQKNTSLRESVLRSLLSAKKEKKHGNKNKAIKAFHEKERWKDARFSTFDVFEPFIGVNWSKSTQAQVFSAAGKVNQKNFKPTSKQWKGRRWLTSAPHSSQSTFESKPNLLTTAQAPQRARNLYNRAYALPFLPSLVCTFQLRDELLNFVESSPFIEDKPILPYCQLERWRPLRDVHKFMSEQMLSQTPNKISNTPLEQAAFKTRNLHEFSKVEAELWKSPHLNPKHKKSERPVLSRKTSCLITQQDKKNKIEKSFVVASKKRKSGTPGIAQSSQNVLGAKLWPISKKRNRQNRMLEHLESLRYILYQALLYKNFCLQTERLQTKNLASTQKVTPVTSLSSVREIPIESPFPSRSSEYSLSFHGISGVRSNFSKEFDGKMLFSRGIQAYFLFLENRSKTTSHARIHTHPNLFKEVPSLIGLAGRLHFQSSEKSYRTFLLERAWLRSLLFEKRLFQGEQQTSKTQSGFAFEEQTHMDTLPSQNGLASYSHSRFVSSLAHAFSELVGNRNQFGLLFFQKYCTSLWSAQKTSWDSIQVLYNKAHSDNKRFFEKNVSSMKSKSAQRLLQSSEKRFVHMVYNSLFVPANNSTNFSFSYDFEQKQTSPIDKEAFQSIQKNSQYFHAPLPSKREKQRISTRALSFFLILPQIQALQTHLSDFTFVRSQNTDIFLDAGKSFQGQVSAFSSGSSFSHIAQVGKSANTFFKANALNFLDSPTLTPAEKVFDQSSLFQKSKVSLIETQSSSLSNFGRGALSKKGAKRHSLQEFHGFWGSQKVASSGQSNALSLLDATTIREILSYTGGGAIEKLLQRFDTQLLKIFLLQDIQTARALYRKKISASDYPPSRVQKRVLTRLGRRIFKNSRRLKLTQLLMRCNRRPEWMMISVLPVLPPDLRPILQMSEGVVAASDLNNLYQRVVYRNNRFHKLSFIDFHLVTAIQRLVQDAVDRLIENGKGGSQPFYTPAGRPLKSLSDTLKGKKGRFRLNLLGKRVDFSGRSVIVVSPHLQIHECGLPREIALELYDYFLLRYFMLKKKAASIVMAKKIMKERTPIVWDALRNIMYHHPVLLNRAPTLHRLGIQAFQPKLVRGNAIFLHPLVCSGFNADFDGDQMGVHLPLSPQARAEAWDLLWARNNLLSPATGQPVLVPSQDMVLGFYYMTQSLSLPSQKKRNVFPQYQYLDKQKTYQTQNITRTRSYTNNTHTQTRALQKASQQHVFGDCRNLLQAFQNKYLQLHTPVWLQWTGYVENDESSQAPIELRLDTFGGSTYVYPKYKRRRDENFCQSQLYIRTTAGRVLLYSTLFE